MAFKTVSDIELYLVDAAEGLCKEVIGPQPHGVYDRVHVTKGRNHDDHGIGIRGPDPAQGLDSVNIRHAYVHDDEVEIFFLPFLKGLASVLRKGHLIVILGQDSLEIDPCVLFIVSD